MLFKSSPIYSLARKIEYEFISLFCRLYKVDVDFLNYGYAGDSELEKKIKIDSKDGGYKYSIQLYEKLLENLNLTGRSVLEVGSGRGGGAFYISRTKNPQSMTGLDISKIATLYASKKFKLKNLKFKQGSSMQLPFQNNSFDYVINVESSHCYFDLGKFFDEVNRVLKPKGTFCYTDRFIGDEINKLESVLKKTNLNLISSLDISQNVFKSLQLDSGRKRILVNKAPKFIRPMLSEFAGLESSNLYKGLEDGSTKYLLYRFEKK